MHHLRVALLQILPDGSVNANLQKGLDCCRKAKEMGADIALFPDADGTMFSGSALVDTENRLALNTSEHEAILLFYTCAGDTSVLSKDKPFTQCLAVSLDGGSTFFKHSRNPLIPQICAGNRDPKIIRSPAGGYVMALYLEKNTYSLFHSENLLDWSQLWTLELPEDTE